jgi:hypothetical protein
MPLLAELALRHAGRPIAVLGGGPSLPEQLAQLPADAVCISANQHGALLHPCRYIVALDDIEDRLRPHGLPIISPRRWADYRVQDFGTWKGNSGLLGLYVAWVLGGHPIIAAGMDCYTGGTYFHDAEAPSSSRDKQPQFFQERARGIPLPASAAVRIVGDGPLTAVWPRYRPDEQFPAYRPPPRLRVMRALLPVPVRWIRQQYFGRSLYYCGESVELSPFEAARLVADNSVEVLQ